MSQNNTNSLYKRTRTLKILDFKGGPSVRETFRLLLILCLSIFVGETLIVLGLGMLTAFPLWVKSLLDPLFLLIVLAPILYFVLFRPLVLELEERKTVEKKMHHLNAILRAIRNVNQFITRVEDQDTLLRRVCDFLVQGGVFHTAWIALVEPSQDVRIMYQAGMDDVFQPLMEQFREGRLTECGRKAMEQSSVVVIEDPSLCTECALAKKYGERSGMTVRLEHAGKIYGLMTVSTPRQFIGEEEERALLKEVAGDIAFALHSLALEEERRQAEKNLRISEERYSTLVEESFDGIFVQRGPKIIFANRRLHDMLGYEHGELVGMEHWLVYHPHYQELTRKRARARMRGEKAPTHYEVKMQRKDGSWFYAEIGAGVITIEGEAGVQVWVKDIMERKEAEMALRRSEAALKSVFMASPLGMSLVHKNRKILWHNRAMSRMVGYSSRELRETNARILYESDEEFQRAGESINALTRENPVTDLETGFVRRDGSTFDCHIWYALLDPEAGESDVLAIVEDITERKNAQKEKMELESQLRQAQKMEAIGTLAGGIAHDFNNILAAVIGMAELAMLEVQEGTSLYRHINQIFKAGMRAKALVQQILAFSRQREEGFIPLSVSPIVKEALKLLQGSFPSTIEIRQCVEKDPGLINGDPTQIHQVLMNLCTNAEHAMRGKGGVLEVRIQQVELNGEMEALKVRPDLRPGGYVCLSVSDSGCGMDEEIVTRIFDPYFTTKEEGEGTGLGLAVVRGIVDKHGGTITVESRVGKGTTFQVFFPIIEGEKREIEEKTEEPLPTGRERILFVDDEEMLASVGKGILGRLGYDVTVRTSSREALELFRAKPGFFDLVITDMSMPNMTGEQLSKELINIRPDIPIILCTGFSHIISKEKALEIGIKAFVMKPIIRKDLAVTVRRVLDGERRR